MTLASLAFIFIHFAPNSKKYTTIKFKFYSDNICDNNNTVLNYSRKFNILHIYGRYL